MATSTFLNTIAAATLLATTALSAYAMPKQTGTYGNWMTFAGTSNDDKAWMCGAGIQTKERSLYINYQWKPTGDLTGNQHYKTGWNIPAGTKVQITMQVDQAPPMKLIAFGHHNDVTGTDFLQASIAGDDVWDQTGKPMIGEILSLIGDGTTVRFFFPDGNEAPWEGSLNGSRAAMLKTSQCVSELAAAVGAAAKPAPTQPFAKTAPTQPFAAAKERAL
jgi:hypothetical protein